MSVPKDRRFISPNSIVSDEISQKTAFHVGPHWLQNTYVRISSSKRVNYHKTVLYIYFCFAFIILRFVLAIVISDYLFVLYHPHSNNVAF